MGTHNSGLIEGNASTETQSKRGIDRQLILALVVSAIVLIVRGMIILSAQSPCVDDNYHLARGLLFLRGDFAHLHEYPLNDPPLGEALVAVPAWLNGQHMPKILHIPPPNTDRPPPPELCYLLPQKIRVETAVWKSLLFLPAIAILFVWTRGIYSAASAWLGLAMLLVEPTFAAHLPLPTVDSLGVEGVVFGCWAIWRYVQDPRPGRQLLAAFAIALALLLKHTGLILPPIAVALAGVHWIFRLKLHRDPRELFRRTRTLAYVGLAAPVLMWILMCFDFSYPAFGRPFTRWHFVSSFINTHAWPCGIYLKSLGAGLAHARGGHASFLLGMTSIRGWWYYFPVVATFKIPIGLWLIFIVSIASLAWVRPRYAELAVLICAAAGTGSLMIQHIDIGFRHFLVPEVFWIVLASRCAARGIRAVSWIVWTAVAATAVETSLWTPDQIAYVNFPRPFFWMKISDSNIDWGQTLWQIKTWMDRHPNETRPISIGYFGPPELRLPDELGPRLTGFATYHGWWIRDSAGVPQYTTETPKHGILFVSPDLIADPYGIGHAFAFLKPIQPKEIIGHAMLVYDLDETPPP